MMVYVAGIVSFGFSCDVPRHVPAEQISVQCAMMESVPAIFAVPVHVPATSASVSVAAGGGGGRGGGFATFTEVVYRELSGRGG